MFSHDGEYPIIGRQGALCGNIKKATGRFYATEHAVYVSPVGSIGVDFACLFLEALDLNQYATATAQPGLSVQKLLDIPFPLPPIPEQKRIVSRFKEISALGEIIDEDVLTLSNLASKAKYRILDLAIRGVLVPQDSSDEPASTLLHRIRSTADKPPCPKNKKNVESEARNTFDCPFSIPESWTWTTLQEISSYRLGKTPPRGQAIFWDHPTVSWVTISDMIDGGHITRTREAVSDYAIASGSAGQLAASGTLLLSFKLTIGKVSILDCPATHNEAIVSIKPIGDFDNLIRNYLFTILPKMVVFVKSSPAVMGNTLNKKSIGEIPIPLPPLAEQRRIVAKVDEMFATIDGMLG